LTEHVLRVRAKEASMSIDIGALNVNETLAHFKIVVEELKGIQSRLDEFAPKVRAAYEMAEQLAYRLSTSRKVNAEAYRIGLESTGTMLETCLEAQALLDACEYPEDRQAVHAFFANGVHDRRSI
jgi:hypothetical protein